MTKKPSLASDPNRRQKVRSAEYGLTILKVLANASGSLSLKALAEALEASPSKVHRYLTSLKESGFVFQDSSTAHYVLGQQASTVGLAAFGTCRPEGLPPFGGASLPCAHHPAPGFSRQLFDLTACQHNRTARVRTPTPPDR